MWEATKGIGVEGSLPDETYVDLIEAAETRDEQAEKKGANTTGTS